MLLRRGPRLWIAVAAGLLAGVVVAVRAAAIEPFLDTATRLALRLPNQELWILQVSARGGGSIDNVHLELPPGLHVLPGADSGVVSTSPGFEFKIDVPYAFPKPFTARLHEQPSGRVTDVEIGRTQ